MEARNRTLPDWLTRIRTRQITLPRFQRFEAWTHRDATNLLNTVLRQLPAGAVLVLEVGEQESFVSRPMEGAPAQGERIVEQLLDGQQRLTSLWRTLNDDYDNRTFFIQLDEKEETGYSYYATSVARRTEKGKRYPLWLDDPVEVWRRQLIPVRLLRPDQDAEKDAQTWEEQATKGDAKAMLDLDRKVRQIREIFSRFNLPFLSLPSTTSKEVALDVFIQMNTSSTPLSTYDIVVAQVEAASSISLHEFADELKNSVPTVSRFASVPEMILAAGALIQNKEPTKASFLSKGFSEGLVDSWDLMIKGTTRTVSFLEEEKVFDRDRLPTDVVVPALVALWAYAPDGLDAEGAARIILRRYLWRSCLTERYELTSATRVAADYRELRKLIDGKDAKPLIFDQDEYPLASEEDLLAAGWPKKRDRLARTVLLLGLRGGGIDLADGSPISSEKIGRREYHHLFPKAWLDAKKRTESEINRALNCTLLSWKTNRHISAKEPAKYLEERLKDSRIGEDEIKRRLETHLVRYDLLQAGDYDAFITERAKAVAAMASRLADGGDPGA